ncbi:MAG: hypothetical protein GY789_18330 [Hyphomicrobiales bacterium]|nr:hypothetical protein [Hyphomicrobiales bacterium]MCP5000946.1 hypothetical protein [Hyphomicrobiales bacterium]
MSKVELDQDEEKPLDPEMEKVRRKMVRLLVVSIGIMILGVMAVLAGVVYKVIGPEDEPQAALSDTITVPSGAPLQLTASLPAGFSVEQVALDGARILFYGRSASGINSAVIMDVSTGNIVAEIELK